MSEPTTPKRPWHLRLLLGSDLKRTLRRGALLALFTYLLLRYVCLPVRLQGVSMEPTLHGGDIHVANLLKYAWRTPQRGDLVVISMTGRHAFYLKRIIGLPGETISFRRGQLHANGQPIPEPYLAETGMWQLAPTVIGANEYFVAGDNRELPIEAHTLGTVDRGKIMGGRTLADPGLGDGCFNPAAGLAAFGVLLTRTRRQGFISRAATLKSPGSRIFMFEGPAATRCTSSPVSSNASESSSIERCFRLASL